MTRRLAIRTPHFAVVYALLASGSSAACARGSAQADEAGPSETGRAGPAAERADSGVEGGGLTDDAGAVDAFPPEPGSVGDPDPFSPGHCVGPALTPAEAASLFATGATEAPLGAFTTFARDRRCNPMTGCEAWSAPVRNAGIAEPWGRTTLSVVDPTNIVMRLRSSLPKSTPPVTCTARVGEPIQCGFALEDGGPSVSFAPSPLRRACFALRHAYQKPAGDGSSTYEIEIVVVGRHRTATQLIAPALASGTHEIAAPCWFCGVSQCGATPAATARYSIQGPAVRVDFTADGPPGAGPSIIVPIDEQGYGHAQLSDRNLDVWASGPTLAVAVSRGGFCQGQAFYP